MTSPRVEKQRQITYTTTQAVSQRTVSKTTAPLLSFNSTQNNTGLSIEHTTKLNQQYVQSYVRVKSKDGKTYNFNKTLENRINNVTAKLQKAEKENGLIGKAWGWTKNTIGFGDSSNKVKEIQANERKLLAQFNANEKTRANVFKQLTGCEYNEENLEKFIKGQIKLKSEIAIQKYKEGQEMAVDITSDVVSGAVAFGVTAACIAGGIAAAPFTAGASFGLVAAGVGIGAAAGSATKVAVKGGEAIVGGKKYSLKQAGKDATIGAVSGALAPITIGAGGAVATSVGKIAPKLATTARFTVEGATFGAADGGTRSALEGDSVGDVALNALKGAGMGVVAGNTLGHGMNAVNKGFGKLTGKIKNNIVQTEPKIEADIARTSAKKTKPNKVEVKHDSAGNYYFYVNDKEIVIEGFEDISLENYLLKDELKALLKNIDNIELLQKLNSEYMRNISRQRFLKKAGNSLFQNNYSKHCHIMALKSLYSFAQKHPEVPLEKLINNKNINFINMNRGMTENQIEYALSKHSTRISDISKKLNNAKTYEDFEKLEVDIINLKSSKQKEKLVEQFNKLYDKFAQVHSEFGIEYKTYPSGKKYGYRIVEDYKSIDNFIEKPYRKTKNENHLFIKNLTHELKKHGCNRARLEDLLKYNKQRTVGTLPEQWGKNTNLFCAEGLSSVDNVLSQFKHVYSESERDIAMNKLGHSLTNLLKQPVKVEYIGNGEIGYVYKISVGDKNYKLKVFKECTPDRFAYSHGNNPELATAIYTNKHSNKNFVKTYFGRFGENNDGYLVTDFLEKDKNYRYPEETLKSYFADNMRINDGKYGENDICGTIVDFGGAYITQTGYLTHNERKILRLLTTALDENSVEKMQAVIKRYENTNDFKRVVQLVKDQEDNLIDNRCHYFSATYVQDRKRLLSMIGVNPQGDITGKGHAFLNVSHEYYGFDLTEAHEIDIVLEQFHAKSPTTPFNTNIGIGSI